MFRMITSLAEKLYCLRRISHALMLGAVILIPTGINAQVNMTVNGTLQSGVIKVNTWQIVPPDYVFAPDYKRDSLESIRTFIKENRHLPGIPSASEITAKGMDLCEMNFKLLQKIEEMTLIILEQDLRLKKLEVAKK